MNRKSIAQTTAVLSVVGAIASGAALLAILGKTLKLSELSLSIVSAVLGVLAGIYSTYFARFAKKLKLSPRVFISYSHADQTVAREIAEVLRTHVRAFGWTKRDSSQASLFAMPCRGASRMPTRLSRCCPNRQDPTCSSNWAWPARGGCA